MEKKDITKTDTQIEIIDTVFLEIKDSIDTKILQASRITKIKDKAVMEAAQDVAKELNNKIKATRELHKVSKAPYWNMCKQFDNKLNTLVDPAEEALNKLKNVMLEYQEEQDRKAEEERQKIIQEREENERKANERQQAVNVMADNLQKHLKKSLRDINLAEKRSDLKIVYDRDVIAFRESIEQNYSMIQDAAFDVTKTIVKVGQMKDNVLKKIEGAKAIYDREIIQYLGPESIAVKEIQNAAAEKKEEIQETAEVKDTGLLSKQMRTGIEPKGINVRVTWDYEMVDWSQVPETWKAISVAEVEKYIEENKKNLTDGFVFNGVKFTAQKKAGLKR